METVQMDKGRQYQLFENLTHNEIMDAELKKGNAEWTRHEFYGILLEEVDELWDCIKENKPDSLLVSELVQASAICKRYFGQVIEIKDMQKKFVEVNDVVS
jgi:hypothetical protein